MAKATIEIPEGHFSERLIEKLNEKGMSVRELAAQTEHTYEMIRKLTKGEAFPSRYLSLRLSEVLDWNKNDIERLTVADRIRRKYGKMPALISGKNPEMEAIERVWPHLSASHKRDLTAQALAWAKLDKRDGKA